MKSKVAIINVYFGKLPSWFQLWLDSCQYNAEFTWILYTDDETEYNYPCNVIRKICTLSNIKEKINETLTITNRIENVYKLCDFKTVYGKIFKEDLKEFSHWGYCDLDMIFGDLSKFITDEVLNKYDRVLNKGHLTIYKNNDVINDYYLLNYSGLNYKEIFESKYHYGFDEIAGFDKLYKENNLPQYIPRDPVIADISFSNYDFRVNGIENYKKQYFYWENGKIFRKYIFNSQEFINEYAYIHFQKRKMSVMVDKFKDKKYIIIPDKITNIYDDKYLYKLNKYNLIKQIERKIKYKKLFINQKIYRLLHWKLKI